MKKIYAVFLIAGNLVAADNSVDDDARLNNKSFVKSIIFPLVAIGSASVGVYFLRKYTQKQKEYSANEPKKYKDDATRIALMMRCSVLCDAENKVSEYLNECVNSQIISDVQKRHAETFFGQGLLTFALQRAFAKKRDELMLENKDHGPGLFLVLRTYVESGEIFEDTFVKTLIEKGFTFFDKAHYSEKIDNPFLYLAKLPESPSFIGDICLQDSFFFGNIIAEKYEQDIDLLSLEEKNQALFYAGLTKNTVLGDLLIKHGANPDVKHAVDFQYLKNYNISRPNETPISYNALIAKENT